MKFILFLWETKNRKWEMYSAECANERTKYWSRSYTPHLARMFVGIFSGRFNCSNKPSPELTLYLSASALVCFHKYWHFVLTVHLAANNNNNEWMNETRNSTHQLQLHQRRANKLFCVNLFHFRVPSFARAMWCDHFYSNERTHSTHTLFNFRFSFSLSLFRWSFGGVD